MTKPRISAIIGIVFVGLGLYIQSLSFDIVNLDDKKYIFDNLAFNSHFGNIIEAFKHDADYPSGVSSYYRPIQVLSHILDANIGGASPLWYHLTNILIHIGTAVLLYLTLLQLGNSEVLAFAATLLFAAHPATVGAVSWIPGRVDLITAFFILFSFLAFLRFLDTGKKKYFVCHAGTFMMALFTKELALIFPALLCLYIAGEKENKPRKSRWVLILLTWVLIILLWSVLWQSALAGTPKPSPITIIKAIRSNVAYVIIALGKMLLPFNISALPTLQNANFVWGALTLLLLGALFFFSKQKITSQIIFGALWTIGFLLPSLYTDDPTSVPIFMEHRLYLPLIGFFMIVLNSKWIQNIQKNKKIFITAVTILLGLYASLAIAHEKHFKNAVTFWEHAAASSPALPKAYIGLGITYQQLGNMEKATEEYEKAVKLNPTEQLVNNNLGWLYLSGGNYEKAAVAYRRELSINPNNIDATINLGASYYAQKTNYLETKILWEQAALARPGSIRVHEYLAIYYYEHENNIEKTIHHIEEIIKLGGNLQPGLQKLYAQYRKNSI